MTPPPATGHAQAARHDVTPLVGIVGNPNVGKTTLFNRLTGQNARVGNYPGVTVERRSGKVEHRGQHFELVDVPGAYSLSARSAEEQIALQAILGISGNARPGLCVVVVDAGQLGRNLYFAVQLLELGMPVSRGREHDRRSQRQPARFAGAVEAARGALRGHSTRGAGAARTSCSM